MDSIVRELIRFNTRYQRQELENNRYFPKGSKLKKLLDQYMKSEKDVVEDSKSKALLMLRLKLINQLVALLVKIPLVRIQKSRFFIDFFSMLKNLYLARLLMALGFYQSGLWLLKSVIKKAQILESWETVLTGSNILIGYYSVRGDNHNSDLYTSLSQHALGLVSKELELKRMYNKWMLIFSKKRSTTNDQIQELGKDVLKGKKIVGELKSINLVNRARMLELIYLDAKMDHSKLLSLSIETARFIRENSGYTDVNKLAFYVGIQMYAYLNLKRLEDAKGLMSDFEKMNRPGTLNWFIFLEYYFVLLIQSGKPNEAYEVYIKIVNNSGYNLLKGVQKDVWTLLTAYMQFLAVSALWKDAPKEIATMDFKSNKFINDVFSLGNDKTGLNVSILILQVLFLLHYGRYEDIFDKKDALRRYIYRYLYSKENERSRTFMTMLLRMIDQEFSFAKTIEKTKRLQTQLASLNMNYRANLGGNEIVDYEILWDWVLNTLKTKWPKAA